MNRLNSGVVLVVLFVAGVAPTLAGTIAYWRLEDGAVGTQATTLQSEFNSATMNGIEGGTGVGVMAFTDSVPGSKIQDGVGGSRVANTSSLSTATLGYNRFDVNDTVNTPKLTEPNIFTFEMFVKSDGALDDLYRVIARKTRGSADGSWILQTNPSGHLLLRADTDDAPSGPNGDPGFNQSVQGPVVMDQKWHHIAVTYDGSMAIPEFNLFMDYAKVGTLIPNPLGTGKIFYDGGVLHIGGRDNGNCWNGWIDEIRFSDTVLGVDQFLIAVPEPGSLTLSVLGAAICLLPGRRRRR